MPCSYKKKRNKADLCEDQSVRDRGVERKAAADAR